MQHWTSAGRHCTRSGRIPGQREPGIGDQDDSDATRDVAAAAQGKIARLHRLRKRADLITLMGRSTRWGCSPISGGWTLQKKKKKALRSNCKRKKIKIKIETQEEEKSGTSLEWTSSKGIRTLIDDKNNKKTSGAKLSSSLAACAAPLVWGRQQKKIIRSDRLCVLVI